MADLSESTLYNILKAMKVIVKAQRDHKCVPDFALQEAHIVSGNLTLNDCRMIRDFIQTDEFSALVREENP